MTSMEPPSAPLGLGDAGSEPATASTSKLAASRQRQILDLLASSEEIQVTALSDRLRVSPETIRRDLKVLEEAGKLRRVHGGAVLIRGNEERPYLARIGALRAEKERIARLFLESVTLTAEQLVFVGGGSTTLPLAQKLATAPPTRFVTNTIDIAVTLARSGVHEVTLTGGMLHKDHELLTGFDTLGAVGGRVFDLVVTSTNAVDVELGFLEDIESEARLHQLLARHARNYVVLADHTKFGRSARFAALSLAAIDLLVTDAPVGTPYQQAFDQAKVPLRWP